MSESDLLEIIDKFDAVICGDDGFSERVLTHAQRLKVISKWGTGIDSIDVPVAKRFGVHVCNTPNAFTNAVADTTLGYCLDLCRGLSSMNADMHTGGWSKQRHSLLAS